MAGLTKTQITYLKEKLQRVAEDKVTEFRKQFGDSNKKGDVLLKKLKSGEVEFLTKEQILEVLEKKIDGCYYSYYPSLSVDELISREDYNRIDNEINAIDKQIRDFENRIYEAKTEALDKIVLEGVDVETALATLNAVK